MGSVKCHLEEFLSFNFLYVVLDESQTIKNPGSKTYQAVMQLKAENRIREQYADQSSVTKFLKKKKIAK